MIKITKVIDTITIFFGIIAGVATVLSVLLVISEIIVRSIFHSTLYITSEYMGYSMVAITFFGMAIALKDKEHIRIVFLQKAIKNNKKKLFLELYTLIVGLIVSLLIFIATTQFVWNSIEIGSRSTQITNTYLAIPQSILVIGAFILFLQFFSEIIKTIININEGKIDDLELESEMLGR